MKNGIQWRLLVLIILAFGVVLFITGCDRSSGTTGTGTEDTGDTEASTGNEDPDTDGDGLKDSEEERLHTDPDNTDTDQDGLPDGEEHFDGQDGTDPTIYNGLRGVSYQVANRISSLCDVVGAIQAQQTDGDVVMRESVCLNDEKAFAFGGADPFNPANIPGFTLGLEADYWAVHYQGNIVLTEPGDLLLRLASTDDDAVVYVDQQPLVAEFIAPTSEPFCISEITQGSEASITLSAGIPHQIDVIFYEKRGAANFNHQVQIPGESDFRTLKKTDVQNATCPAGF